MIEIIRYILLPESLYYIITVIGYLCIVLFFVILLRKMDKLYTRQQAQSVIKDLKTILRMEVKVNRLANDVNQLRADVDELYIQLRKTNDMIIQFHGE